MKLLFLFSLFFLILSGDAQPYYPLAGGWLQGDMYIPYGNQIQSPYYGFNAATSQPSHSGNVAIFPNNNTFTLDIVGWGAGCRFISCGQSPYPSVPVFSIDNAGNTEAAGIIKTGFGEKTCFKAGEYLRMGHTAASYLPYISFNAELLSSPFPYGDNLFGPRYPGGSGLIMVGGAGNSTIRFLQYKYNNSPNAVSLNSFTQTLSINEDGEVGIGLTNLAHTGYSLAVNGNIAAKRIKVMQGQNGQWPDYVFDPGYKLIPLDSLAFFVTKNKHLPDVPTASQVESEGLDVQDTQAALLKKIEELTLYLIKLERTTQQQQQQIQKQAKEIQALQTTIR